MAVASPRKNVRGLRHVPLEWEDDRQVLLAKAVQQLQERSRSEYPGIFNIKDYGAKLNGITDDLAAYQAAIDAAEAAGGGTVWHPPGTALTSSGLVNDSGRVVINGAGGLFDGSRILYTGTTGDVITFTGVQHSGIKDIYIRYASKPTAGNGIVFDSSCFRCFADHNMIERGYNGIKVDGCTETRVTKTILRSLYGTSGILYTGSLANKSFRAIIDDITADNPYPGASPTAASVKTWAISTAFSLNDITHVNSAIYQCLVAGTSAGSGGGPSGGDFDTNIVDGTVEWRFVCSNSLNWIVQDNYAYSLVIDKAACLNGARGFQMKDTAATGTSYPIWAFVSDLECDHNFFDAVLLERGEGFYAGLSWWGSSLSANGLDILNPFRGEVRIDPTNRIVGNAQAGVIWVAGPVDIGLYGCIIGDNSAVGSGMHPGISVGAGAKGWKVRGVKSGDTVSVTGNFQSWGLINGVGAGDDYEITGNDFRGNVVGGLFDGGTGTNIQVYGNLPFEDVDNFVLGGGLVSEGAVDSGGAGFKLLRVPN